MTTRKFKLLFSLLGVLVTSTAFPQTAARTVMVQSNNAVLLYPTNFWSANAAQARVALGIGSIASNSASAYQSASPSLTNLSSNNGSALTNLIISNVVGLQSALGEKLATNGNAVHLTNFPPSLLRTNGSAAGLTNFPVGVLTTNGDGAGLTNITAANITGIVALASNLSSLLAVTNGGTAATNAATARTNLGLRMPALTNTDTTNFRKDIGLVGTGVNSSIGGGLGNTASGTNSVVSGGHFNEASGADSMVIGGTINRATGTNSSVIGGGFNTASGRISISGGVNSTASGEFSTTLNGLQNTASGQYSIVVGGGFNTASGYMSTVINGLANTASADYAFAAGRRARATNAGSFVWSDSTDADFSSSNNNSFNVRAQGGLSFDLGTNGISFRNITNAAVTRTNLGLGASWLLSTNTPVFVGTNGEVVSPTNFWQVAPIVARFVETQPNTNFTTNIPAARDLHIHSLAANIVNVTNTIALPVTGSFNGDIALVVHQGPTSSVTAVRTAGAGTNLITLNRPNEAVEFVYYNSVWQFNHNPSFVEPIFFSGTNAAANTAASRTNLGLGWPALTNTNAATSLLGFTTNGQVVANTGTNALTFTNGTVFFENISAGALFSGTNEVYEFDSGQFAKPIRVLETYIAETRTNLGLPLEALTNTSNVTAMRALSGSTNTNHPFSGSVSVVGTNNTNTLVFSNGILQSVQ